MGASVDSSFQKMGKGIKMRSALDRHGKVYSIERLEALHDRREEIPSLKCACEPCGCAVRFVPRYQKNRSGYIEPINVPAYIGLTSSSEHVDNCVYSAEGQLSVIVAQSDREFLVTLGSGQRELRLLVLHNGLGGRGLSGVASTANVTAAGLSYNGDTTNFDSSGQKISSYLRTTTQLVILRFLCESDSFLASEIVLRLGRRRIPWKQFFFDRERYNAAWKLMKDLGTDAFPIVLVGVVHSHYLPSEGAKFTTSYLNCKPIYRETDSPQRVEKFEVSIAHEDGKWLTGFPKGSHIVMFGIWQAQNAKDIPDEKRPVTYVTRKLSLKPRFRSQVIRIEES